MTHAAPPFGSSHRRRAVLDRLAAVRIDGSPTAIRAAELDVVSTYLNFAGALATRYRDRGLDAEDLQQLARLGLARAVRQWHPSGGADFVEFAYPIIVDELEKHLRDQPQIAGLPRSMRQLRAETRLMATELRRGQAPRDSSEGESGLGQTG